MRTGRKFGMMIGIVFAVLSFQTLPAQIQADGDTERVTLSNLSTGWMIDIHPDGSARITYGAGDQMMTPPDLFAIGKIESDLKLLGEGASPSGITGSIRKKGQQTVTSRPVETPDHVRDIVRKAFENAGNVGKGLGPRFREIIRDHPPFGITDLQPSDEQLERSIPMSLTFYRQFHPGDITGDEPTEYYTVDRKSRAYYESIRKNRTKKRPAASLETEAGRPTKRERTAQGNEENGTPAGKKLLWPGIVVLAVTSGGLVWRLLKTKGT